MKEQDTCCPPDLGLFRHMCTEKINPKYITFSTVFMHNFILALYYNKPKFYINFYHLPVVWKEKAAQAIWSTWLPQYNVRCVEFAQQVFLEIRCHKLTVHKTSFFFFFTITTLKLTASLMAIWGVLKTHELAFSLNKNFQETTTLSLPVHS